ncbi:hypothetical protein BGX38DRAFT_1142937 [Terfezia claveryi]|nr:hypothetical protein BGX38DRAFT_1142937 [Terfezia claveryi]
MDDRVYVEPPKTEVFKYDTTVTTYKRFLATWNAHPSNVRTLLLAAIKADIHTRLATLLQKGSLESDQPLKIGDASAFEAELTQELHEATQAIQLARQRIPDAFRRRATRVRIKTTSRVMFSRRKRAGAQRYEREIRRRPELRTGRHVRKRW